MNKKKIILYSGLLLLCVFILRTVFHFVFTPLCVAMDVDMCRVSDARKRHTSMKCSWPVQDKEFLEKEGWVECSNIQGGGEGYIWQVTKPKIDHWFTGRYGWRDCKGSECTRHYR